MKLICFGAEIWNTKVYIPVNMALRIRNRFRNERPAVISVITLLIVLERLIILGMMM
jgi:hypothetical protein